MNLTANARGLSVGLASAQRSVLGFATSTKALLAGIAGAFGVGLSTVALKNWIGGQAEAIDATAKLADRLGVSTETLVGWQHAARLANVDNETLTTGLNKLARESVGPLDVAFAKVADQIADTTDAGESNRTAFDRFGKSGQKLLPMLADGAAGLKAAEAEARKMGSTFSRLDASTVEAANDSITRMQELMEAAGRVIAVQLAPHVDRLATRLFEGATAGEGFGLKVAAGFEAAAIGAAKMLDILNKIEAKRAGAGSFLAIKAAEMDLSAAKSRVGNLELQLKNPAVGDAEFEKRFRQNVTAQLETERHLVQVLEAQLQKLKEPAAALSNHAEEVTQYFAEIKADAALVNQYTGLTADSVFNFSNAAAKGAGAFGDMADNLDRSAKSMQDLEKRIVTFNASAFKNQRGLMQMLEALEQQASGVKTKKISEPAALADFGGTRLAEAVERRFTVTSADDRRSTQARLAERQLREQEKTKDNTKTTADNTAIIAQKLNNAQTIGLFTLN